ncbi:MAG TPA: hypothetical protein VMR70_20330 [Flavisolibacter sp.]|nr:hypothetical protein [Flavisolibacter sp.]
MEQKFLQYVLYITLVELREKAYAENDSRTFWLCDLLHNVPSRLSSSIESKKAYEELMKGVKHLEIERWLEARLAEFHDRFPEFKN